MDRTIESAYGLHWLRDLHNIKRSNAFYRATQAVLWCVWGRVCDCSNIRRLALEASTFRSSRALTISWWLIQLPPIGYTFTRAMGNLSFAASRKLLYIQEKTFSKSLSLLPWETHHKSENHCAHAVLLWYERAACLLYIHVIKKFFFVG